MSPVTNPREVPEAQAVIRRLCKLQAYVASEVLGYDDPADCFCGESGYWPLSGSEDYRNALRAIEFIEDATLAEVHRRKAAVVERRRFQRERP